MGVKLKVVFVNIFHTLYGVIELYELPKLIDHSSHLSRTKKMRYGDITIDAPIANRIDFFMTNSFLISSIDHRIRNMGKKKTAVNFVNKAIPMHIPEKKPHIQ
jgi:hypothetical protein